MCQYFFYDSYDSESELDSSRACFSFHLLYLSIRSIRNDVFLVFRVINLCFKSSLAVGLWQRQYRHCLLIIHDYTSGVGSQSCPPLLYMQKSKDYFAELLKSSLAGHCSEEFSYNPNQRHPSKANQDPLSYYNITGRWVCLGQGSPNLVLDGWCPAEFSSNPN